MVGQYKMGVQKTSPNSNSNSNATATATTVMLAKSDAVLVNLSTAVGIAEWRRGDRTYLWLMANDEGFVRLFDFDRDTVLNHSGVAFGPAMQSNDIYPSVMDPDFFPNTDDDEHHVTVYLRCEGVDSVTAWPFQEQGKYGYLVGTAGMSHDLSSCEAPATGAPKLFGAGATTVTLLNLAADQDISVTTLRCSSVESVICHRDDHVMPNVCLVSVYMSNGSYFGRLQVINVVSRKEAVQAVMGGLQFTLVTPESTGTHSNKRRKLCDLNDAIGCEDCSECCSTSSEFLTETDSDTDSDMSSIFSSSAWKQV